MPKSVFGTSYFTSNNSAMRYTYVSVMMFLLVVVVAMLIMLAMKDSNNADKYGMMGDDARFVSHSVGAFVALVTFASIAVSALLSTFNNASGYASAYFAFYVAAFLSLIAAAVVQWRKKDMEAYMVPSGISLGYIAFAAMMLMLVLISSLIGTNESGVDGVMTQSTLVVPLFSATVIMLIYYVAQRAQAS